MYKPWFFFLSTVFFAIAGAWGVGLEAAPLPIQATAASSAANSTSGENYSGMYGFLRDGEFVQITVEDKGKLTGFVSRYGELDSDRGAFLDQFFKQGSIDGQNLSFSTETVHGAWFEFKGTVGRGQGKTADDEGYYVLKGMLIQHSAGADHKDVAKSREVVFKSFPQDVSAPTTKPKD